VKTLRFDSIKRMIILGLATVAVAGLAPSRPAHAAGPMYLVGQTFELHDTPAHDGSDSFKITWEDNQGNLIVEVTRSGKKCIGVGKLTEVPGTIGSVAFTMEFAYNPNLVFHYEGAIRQWGNGVNSYQDSEWMAAGTYSNDLKTIFGPATVRPRPFCATSKWAHQPG
jgi:hypothetical protein